MAAISKMSFVALAASLILAGCDSGTEPPPPAAVVARVAVDPATRALVVGEQSTYTARAFGSEGQLLEGRAIAWSSGNADVASVSAGGVVSAVAPGTSAIRATVDGVIGTAEVVVGVAPVASIEVTPATVELIEGEARVLQAVARDAVGRVVEGRTIVWSSLAPAVAEVDANGKIVARGAGQAMITATVEGRSASVAVTVARVPVATVTVTPTALLLEVGETRQLTAIVKDAAGTVLTGRVVTWTGDANVSATAGGLVTALRPGYAGITATSEGKTFVVAATISAEEPSAYELLYHRRMSASTAEIFLLALGTGATPARLNAGNVSSQPTASPDGARIAFAVSQIDLGTQKQIDDIFAVNRDGMAVRQLTTSADVEDQPDWSPSGHRIAYRRYSASGRMDIWSMSPDGTGQVNLTADLAADVRSSAPAWSADGTRLAFATTQNEPAARPRASGSWMPTVATSGG